MSETANRASKPRVCREHFNGRCMEKAEGSSPYCKQHKFEHYVRQRKLNRRAGLCKCGNKPIDGQSARGKRYTTCATCLTKQRTYDGARLAEIKALPDDIRRYAGNGRYAGFRALALSLHRVEQDRRDKAIEAAQAVLPKLDNRKRLFIQQYVELGAKWGAGERAAIMAGYGKISAYQGGRSAAVKASVLLRQRRSSRDSETDSQRFSCRIRAPGAQSRARPRHPGLGICRSRRGLHGLFGVRQANFAPDEFWEERLTKLGKRAALRCIGDCSIQ